MELRRKFLWGRKHRYQLWLKHRANDVLDGSWSRNNRRDHSGLNGCCTAIWKANGKSNTLLIFKVSLLPKTHRTVLYTVQGAGISYIKFKKRLTWLVTSSLLKYFTEGKTEWRSDGKTRKKSKQLLGDLKETRGDRKLKEEAVDRTLWRSGCGPVIRLTTEWTKRQSIPEICAWQQEYAWRLSHTVQLRNVLSRGPQIGLIYADCNCASWAANCA
jgi:hypothetical protein